MLHQVDDQVIGALAIQLQEQNQKPLLDISEQIVTSLNQANEGVTSLADGAENLSRNTDTLLEQSNHAQVNNTDEVLTFIKKIAEQTNLLGLNASIGNIVEVRKEQAASTEEIAAFIHEI